MNQNNLPEETPKSPFEAIKHLDDQGSEYWFARELMKLLKYSSWQKFEEAIERAKVSCDINGKKSQDHFNPEVNMIIVGKGAQRQVPDYRLTKYACHIIAMNGDVRKKEIADAQAYFVYQTQFAENIQGQDTATNNMHPLDTRRDLSDFSVLEDIKRYAEMTIHLANHAIEEKKKREIAEKQLQIAAPKAEKYDAFMNSDGMISGSMLARIIGAKFTPPLGRNDLYNQLEREGIISTIKVGQLTGKTTNQQFQKAHPDFLEVKIEKGNDGKWYSVVYFTPVFIDWYIQKHKFV